MKKLTFTTLLAALLFGSCSVQKIRYDTIEVYKNDKGIIFPDYLTLKKLADIYDLYLSAIRIGVTGEYEMKGDTLCLYPKFKHLGSTVGEIELDDVTITDIPVFFIKKGDKLIDITEYEKYPNIAPWFKNGDVYNFERLRWGK